MHGLPQPTTSTRAMREKFVEQQEQLRELLEFVESNGSNVNDIATRLRAILDGE